MTDIDISVAARDWVAAQGGVLTLRLSTRYGCCGGQAGVPVAELGAPREAAGYTPVELDGLRVFVADALGEGPYRIDLEGLFRWRRLAVAGAMGQM
ncbi:MAG: hypothetical protein EA420_00145 [Candidatus Competibacteraceae bacterium]|jgi:hypothetical protein|nr:MAG: hypothetical protein EA420_00145 [Candidatus Competibacteraceae bacterium]